MRQYHTKTLNSVSYLTVAFLTAVFLGLLVNLTLLASTSQAASFNAGRIIDDEIFYDKDAMGSAQDVQRFINNHTPACDTWGTKSSGYGNLTRAQYATQVMGWHGPPYVCLQNYHENPTNGESSYEKGGGSFSGGQSSGQIIWDAAQKYSINPQVLLVLLRKESAGPLFADSWPLKSQYRYAMGYGCPDSGPGYSANCQADQGGFYKQVEKAAWQLRFYRNNMHTYNYQPGRVNRIQYAPNPACGTKDVYIENYATASLYIYTPYTPNDAALAAYPGEASCGAYGNRNFWFFFQEWFGTTQINSNFLRSTSDATVYLVSGNVKYPVADGRLISAATPLGGVGYVSQSYLNAIPTGQTLGRLIRGPDGTVYFYDSGIKLAFTSCASVEDFGYKCGDSALLTDVQIKRFTEGPRMMNGYGTTQGKRFYVSKGEKREVVDSQSLSLNGLSTVYNNLSEDGISHLPYGTPVLRDGVVIKNRQNLSQEYITDQAKTYVIRNSDAGKESFSSLSTAVLDKISLDKVVDTTRTIDTLVHNQQGTQYILTKDGKKLSTAGSIVGKSTLLSDTLLLKIKGVGSVSNPVLLKSPKDGTVYAFINGQKRPFVAMEDLRPITGETNPYIAVVSSEWVNSIPNGNIVIGAGSLVKSPNDATVYVTDGVDRLIPMSSFTPALDLGLKTSIRTFSVSTLDKYNIDTDARLRSYVSCMNKTHLGIGGSAYEFSLQTHSPLELDNSTCNAMNKSIGKTPRFILGQDGTIFEIVDRIIYPISTMRKYEELNTGKEPLVKVSSDTINFFARGNMK